MCKYLVHIVGHQSLSEIPTNSRGDKAMAAGLWRMPRIHTTEAAR